MKRKKRTLYSVKKDRSILFLILERHSILVIYQRKLLVSSLASPESYQWNICNRIWEQKSVMCIIWQDNSNWKGAQEFSSPTSFSGQGQRWGWTRTSSWVLKTSKDGQLEMWSNMGVVEADNHFPRFTVCAAVNAAQDAVGLLCWRSTLRPPRLPGPFQHSCSPAARKHTIKLRSWNEDLKYFIPICKQDVLTYFCSFCSLWTIKTELHWSNFAKN